MSKQFFIDPIDEEQMHAGTGFMLCLTDAIRDLEKKGYSANLVAEFDHFRDNQIQIFPPDFDVEDMIRFENSSDPDDQSILYAISSRRYGIKGLYIDSYGLYHNSLSTEMLDRIKFCHKRSKDFLWKAQYTKDNCPAR